MPKNIAYQTKKKGKSVAGEAKDIKRLRTNLQGGGTCDWVPEDETQLIAKVITKDGTYNASDEPGDIYGYSEVTVQGIGGQIMGDLGTITIRKNGTYYARNAYSQSDLGFTKTSSGDGTNKIGPFYGYKTVIVNVSGGSSGGGSSGGSSGGGSAGSGKSVVGKDEEGNYVQWTVGEDGVLKETKLADSIQITKKPKFLTYRNGDRINFQGIKVTAYAGSTVYKADMSETSLSFPVNMAIGGDGSSQTIPVTWNRDGDGMLLETSFTITVNDA